MPKIVYDYNKCDGNASCAEVCPVTILEKSGNGRWCKPKDDKVENAEAIKKFHEKVENEKKQVNVVISNDMPECISCRACEAACTKDAIKFEE